jgi:hypothetical protein
LENSKYEEARKSISNRNVARHFEFYKPLDHAGEREIWDNQKASKKLLETVSVPDDERVEDAGLELDPILKDN